VLLFAAGLVPLLLAGCAPGNTNGAALAKAQSFTWPYNPATKVAYQVLLDPATLEFARDSANINMLYVGLVSLDGNLNVQGDAATAWDVDKTGTIYTFHLRPNMKFSDGTPLTAKDFAYSINRSLDPTLCDVLDAKTYGDPNGVNPAPCDEGVNGVGLTYLGHILGASDRATGKIQSMIGNGSDPTKGLDVVDPLTLQIRLDQPVAFFLEALTYPTSYAVEQAFIEKPQYAGGTWVDHLDQGGCSGPFQVQTYGDGTTLTLTPNTSWEDAWDKHITLTQVVRPSFGSLETEYDDFRKGQFDYTDVPGDAYQTAHGQGDFHEIPTLVTLYFGMNWTEPPFGNTGKVFVNVDGEKDQKDVGEVLRRAFALALNKQLLVDRVEQGGAIPTNHIVPKGMPGYYQDLKNPLPDGSQSVTGNQAAAQTLLKAAQATCPAVVPSFDKTHAYCAYIMGSNPKEIDVYTKSADQDQTRYTLGQVAAQQWAAALNLNVKVVGLHSSALRKTLAGVPDPTNPTHKINPIPIWTFGWLADYADPQDWLSLQFATGAGYNVGGVSNSGLDQLMASADAEPNTTKRLGEYNLAEQQVINSVAWIPFEQGKFYWRQRTWVRGFGLNALQLIPDTGWSSVAILDH
jgi:peptide/nickel transport system substrate-binding protein/oligopeptide transport system substrate-binding protein